MANNLFDIKGIGLKVYALLQIANDNIIDDDTLEQIAALTEHHSENIRLGKVLGYSVSEYAFATLKWIGTSDSLKLYDTLITPLPESRKTRIYKLISSNVYLSAKSTAVPVGV